MKKKTKKKKLVNKLHLDLSGIPIQKSNVPYPVDVKVKFQKENGDIVYVRFAGTIIPSDIKNIELSLTPFVDLSAGEMPNFFAPPIFKQTVEFKADLKLRVGNEL
jgi:hypothetical protein